MTAEARQFIEELYYANQDKLFRLAYRLVGSEEKAEELVQEAFVLAILHEAELLTHPKPDKWLMVTLKYQILNYWRRKESSSELSLDDFFSLEAEPIRDPLETVLPKELTEAERQVLIWRVEEQLDYVEMSERLGVTQNACRLRLMRAVRECRRYWDKNF